MFHYQPSDKPYYPTLVELIQTEFPSELATAVPTLKYILILKDQLSTCGWRVHRADDASGQPCWTEEMEADEVDRVLEEFVW